MTKELARKYARLIRVNADIKVESEFIIKKIIDSKMLDSFSNIGLYFPLPYEIDLTALFVIYPNKNFYLPITKDILEFALFEGNEKLLDGPFHTKEPYPNKLIDINNIDIIFIPCVAISKDKKRLGYGKGYYDKTFENYKGLKVGVCLQKLKDLDIIMNQYDLVMDLIL